MCPYKDFFFHLFYFGILWAFQSKTSHLSLGSLPPLFAPFYFSSSPYFWAPIIWTLLLSSILYSFISHMCIYIYSLVPLLLSGDFLNLTYLLLCSSAVSVMLFVPFILFLYLDYYSFPYLKFLLVSICFFFSNYYFLSYLSYVYYTHWLVFSS